jgi:hypothetical protein
MHVRSGIREDLLDIGRIAEAGFWDAYTGLLKPDTIGRMLMTDYSPSAVRRRLLRGGVVVSIEDGGLVAFVDAVPDAGSLQVSSIACEPYLRRRGHGSGLITEVRRQHPSLPLSADVLLGHFDAEAFFESLGFVPGEVVHRRLFDEDVVERRWWLEPAFGDTLASG